MQSDTEMFDLSKYIDEYTSAELLYPSALPCRHALFNKHLTVKLENVYSARLFKIK